MAAFPTVSVTVSIKGLAAVVAIITATGIKLHRTVQEICDIRMEQETGRRIAAKRSQRRAKHREKKALTCEENALDCAEQVKFENLIVSRRYS